MKKSIYLDYAAATPIAEDVLEAMKPFFADYFYNPSGVYLAGREVRRSLDAARQSVARCLGAKPGEVVFTAGATEANNLAIQGIMTRFPKAEILVSSIEHDSVLQPASLFNHRLIPVDKTGVIDSFKLAKMINPNTALISVMYVNNELGTIQPLKEIANLIKQENSRRSKKGESLPLYLHSDAAQAPNYMDIHVSRLNADLMSINGGKIYGPKQSGALYIKSGITVRPMIYGGGQEMGIRAGTENITSAVGLAKALSSAQATRKGENDRLAKLRNLFIKQVTGNISDAVVNGSPKNQAPHIIHLTLPIDDNERLMMELDEAGVICAVGSACSASSAKPSHVLAAIGMEDRLARASSRFSIGRQTTEKDIAIAAAKLVQLTRPNR